MLGIYVGWNYEGGLATSGCSLEEFLCYTFSQDGIWVRNTDKMKIFSALCTLHTQGPEPVPVINTLCFGLMVGLMVACQPRSVVKAAGKKLAVDGKWNEVCWILGRRKTRDWTNKSAFSWHGNSSLCKQECRFLCCNGFSSLLPMPLWFLGFCIPLPQSPSKLSESTLVRRARMPQMPPSLLEVS